MGLTPEERLVEDARLAKVWFEESEKCRTQLAAVTAERDAALAELAEVKKNMLRFSADGMRITRENTKADALELALSLMAERDALAAQLAALKKRVADAERVDRYFPTRTPVPQIMTFALLRLEEGE